MNTALDIVIVSFNTVGDLRVCLRSLHDAPPARAHTICVVDNASTDGSQAMVETEFPNVTLLPLERNVGFAAANNVGIRTTNGPLVLLLNSDTIVPPGAVDRLIERMESSGAVAAGPRLVNVDGQPEVSWGPMLTPLGEARQAMRMRLAGSSAPWARRRVQRWTSVEREVDWVTGACLLVRREPAEAAGLLDERYFMYEEDVDFCAALRARGGRVLFAPSAEIVHKRGGSFAATGGAPSPLYDRSHLTFYAKHAPHWVPLLRLWLLLRGRQAR